MHCEVPVNVNFQHNQFPETERAQLFSVVTCGGGFVLRDYFNTSVELPCCVADSLVSFTCQTENLPLFGSWWLLI